MAIYADMSSQITQALDKLVVDELFSSGDSTTAGSISTNTLTASGTDDWEDIIPDFYERVDGLRAYTTKDISGIMNAHLYGYLAKELRGGNSADRPLLDVLTKDFGTLEVCNFVPAKASKTDKTMLYRSASGLEPSRLAMWNSVEFIHDPYTNATTGLENFTAFLLCGFGLIRADHYYMVKTRVES